MAKASKVSPTLNPNISHDDDVDDNGDENNDEESDNIASLKIKGEMIFKSIYKNKLACSNFLEIMSIATEGKKYIEELEAHLEEHEATIETMEGHEREYANEIAELSQALENEQTTKESLEETFAIELSRLKESHVTPNFAKHRANLKVGSSSVKLGLERSEGAVGCFLCSSCSHSHGLPKAANRQRRKLNSDDEDLDFVPEETSATSKAPTKKDVRKFTATPADMRAPEYARKSTELSKDAPAKKAGVKRPRKRTIHLVGRKTSMYEDPETAEE
ncbi:hypothetical protein D1007_22012 [Hordeum vulgare]|nr:hypothetical protein D1007_22012 [Hordeum vulgare]